MSDFFGQRDIFKDASEVDVDARLKGDDGRG